MRPLDLLLSTARALLMRRAALALENLALRHQIGVLRRTVKRPRLEDRDRRLWILLLRWLGRWRECLLIVRPETALTWHKKGWRAYWRRKSVAKRQGRPPIGWPLVRLIQRMSRENVTWGSRRIHSELALLGHEVGESTVQRYMLKRRRPGGGQAWMTFLRNHLKVTAACDFFVVPTVKFRNLLVFVVLSHDRRRIEHVAVTRRPTAAWAAEQIEAAFPVARPRMLVRDNDGVFGHAFRERIAELDIEDRPIRPASPWMNCYCERVIGTLRRECTDHIIALGPRHLERALREYVAYYNEARPHISLERNAPERRRRATRAPPKLNAEPVLGGLHHRYRAAG